MSQKGNKNEERSAQASLTPQKPIRPYICSTPKDLQEERDFLARHVFPELNERCQARGTYFKAVDLRCSGLESQAPVAPHLLRQHSCLASQHLKLCLDCVNSCLPFFICVLGQAYGDFLQDYAPGIFSRATDLSSLSPAEQKLYVAAKNGYPWVLESPSCSLTELEVTQAAFRNASPFQYFYFRTGPSRPQSSDREKEGPSPSSLKRDMEKLKMGKLKAKILSRGLPVRFYRSLQELGELVFKDWSAVIESLYPSTVMLENIDYKHSFERSYHEEFTKKCEQEFVISKESNRIFEALERFALKDVEFDLNGAASASSLDSVLRINPLPTYKSILLVSGERGCGKSTLIANWVNYFRKKHPRMLLVPYFVGSTCDSSDIMSVIHYFITELQDKIYGTPLETDALHEDPSLWVFSLLVERFLASISLKPCILVLDGIEELIGIYGISGPKAKDFSWLPCSLAPHCKFILSTVSSSLSYKALCARPDVRTMELISTGEAEAQLRIFRQHLSTPSSDPFRQRRQALRKKTNLNPLKLTILASESKECRIYRNELQCMKAYLEVPSIQDLWELILKRWVEDYSWNFTRKKGSSDALASGEGLDGWVADTLCLLSISHCGLAEDEILQLLDMLGYRDQHTVTLLHWAAFRNASKEWVLEKPDGLLCFRHQSLRKAVEHRLLGGTAPVRECGPYAFQNPTNHKKTQLHQALVSYFQQHAAFWRVFQELPWHLKMSGSWEDLCNFLTSPNVTDFLSKLRSPSFWTRLHLLHYWGVLTEVGYDVTRTYLLSVDKIKTSPCHKAHARGVPSVLEKSAFLETTSDKCRLLAFIARVLKHMGNTKEAEQLLLDVEDILVQLVQNQSPMEMLSTVQNALGELYLEIGMTQEAFQYFLRAWSTLTCLPPSDLKTNQNLVKQQGRVLNNLTKSGSEEFLKQNYILEYATELAQLLDNNPNDQATMKYTEGVLRLAAGNVSLAKMKFQECLNIRRSLFGKTNILVGEIMEYLADLLFFPLHGERFQRKQVIDYYKQVVKIKENTEALTNSSLIRKQLCISLSDTLCKLAGQLLLGDSSHYLTMEAVGYLYRSLDLRTTYLGAAHPSIPGIVNLLKEIDRLQGRRYYLPDICHQSAEGSRTGGPLGKDVRKLRYHSSQNSHTVSSALCLDADQLQRAKSADFALNPISDASECISGKQNKSLRPITCIPVRKKTRPKTQNHVELWNGPEKETSKKKKPFPSKILALGEMNSVVKLSRQRVTSTSGSGTQQITTIYQHPLVEALSSAQPLDSVVELISEKWLFHSPDSSLTPQKYFWRRKPQMDTKWYQPLNDTNKE